MHKIVLFGNFADNNLGDRLYPVTFMGLFNRYGGDSNFTLLDIHGRDVSFEKLEDISKETDIAENTQSNGVLKKIYKATYPLSREALWYFEKPLV